MSWKCLHLFSGAGGGALGFQRAGFTSVGNFDFDAAACADLTYLTGEPARCVDLATMSPQELASACTCRPDVVFTSPPCKAFSGCLPLLTSKTDKYVEMSSLALRSVWLTLEAWETPPALILLENVPRIKSRGRQWLNRITALLQSYGYAVQETTHDCGELGGLAQHRRRFLLVARHMAQVPEFLYVPPVRRVRGVGEVLGTLPIPLPDSSAGGPMHHLPRLSPLNWLRLALIPAGGDWRDMPEVVALPTRAARHNGGYGVNNWSRGSHTVVGASSVSSTWSSLADPRIACTPRSGVYGVTHWLTPSGTVVGAASPDNGKWAVADPRVECERREGGHGVKGWGEPSTPVIGHASIHNHPASVADPRSVALVGGPLDLDTRRPTHLVIQAIDGTWHRPMTTLELAALQGFPAEVNGEPLRLHGKSHAAWRQRIGNAVPPPAAEAIGHSCITTLEASAEGRLLMSGHPVWVGPRNQEVGA